MEIAAQDATFIDPSDDENTHPSKKEKLSDDDDENFEFVKGKKGFVFTLELFFNLLKLFRRNQCSRSY